MAERDVKLAQRLHTVGIAPEVTGAALEIDAILQRWRRRFSKRELGLRAIDDLRLDLDLAELDALVAICAPQNEFGDEPQSETMVATVAARLGIDPSRASRLTTGLIARGLVRRAVSQQDARRTILEPTEDGARIMDAVRAYKFMVLGDFLSGWTPEEIRTFIPLLERFSVWSDQTARLPAPLTTEITRLRKTLPAGGAKKAG
ncbi:MarR family transcriptional regulator [Rhodobacterales bacterium HKCCE3408]|nr:MarR family transcriptional regulator [Rhodobacterales bacterium HKCCE3408]